MQKRILSLLVLLMTAVTGAWADTTVTWTASDMSGIYIDFLDGEANNNTIKGITVTSSGGGGAGDGWERTDINLDSGSTTITFTSSVGNIKSIAITAENIEMSSIPSGWTTDYSTLSWSGEASTTVPLPLSGWTEISGISEIVFTIESTVNVTGITLDKTEASMIVGGETLTLTPTVAPGNATDKSVTWTTSDAAVATVANGVVTAVGAGTATITVTTTDGAFTATCAVTVAAPATSTYTVTLKEGTEDATSWTIAPAEATTTGVATGTTVTANYSGAKKVKSVKAVKKAGLPVVNGKFSVSDTKQVYFSKGNLRYASGAWSFFDKQYDYYNSYSADAWDHFGWSTSTTYGMNTSTNESDYSGDFVDWGATMGTGWSTLSKDEWTYLLNTRSASTVNGTENGRYAKAKVNNVHGMILFPDTYTHPDDVTAPTGVNATNNTGWDGNSYTVEDWTKMESAGCVFLPAAGSRSGSTVDNADVSGYYWSATHHSTANNASYNVSFTSGTLNPAGASRRKYGYSVRLVRQVTE